jgi:serine/threonine-protein kinase
MPYRSSCPGIAGLADADGGDSRPEERDGAVLVVAGRYELLEVIGQGGMGVVWRAFDVELEEVVAIKFLHDDMAGDARRRACFRREVKLARRVTHSNVARVFEFGCDRGAYFLTMEFVPGQSLEAVLLRQGRLPAHQVLRHAVGLCRGLAAAHEAGILHGDIKPANILLAPGRGAVLTDCGIARAVCDVLGQGENMGGTPLYMAPEQLTGGPLALQSDVYATGVVLFEALTGRTPWVGEDEALLKARSLSLPDLRSIAPGLSEPWARLIAGCLRVDPAGRPADGRALLAGLREVAGARHDAPGKDSLDVSATYAEQPGRVAGVRAASLRRWLAPEQVTLVRLARPGDAAAAPVIP